MEELGKVGKNSYLPSVSIKDSLCLKVSTNALSKGLFSFQFSLTNAPKVLLVQKNGENPNFRFHRR